MSFAEVLLVPGMGRGSLVRARDSIGGNHLTLIGRTTRTDLLAAWTESGPDGSYLAGIGNSGSLGAAGNGTMTGFSDVDTARVDDVPAGMTGHSIAFNGTSNYVLVPDNAAIRFDAGTLDFSITLRIKTSTVSKFLFDKRDTAGDGYGMYLDASGYPVLLLDAITLTGTVNVCDGVWHTVGVSIDRDGNGQLFADGVATGAAVAISSEAMATVATLKIGANVALTSWFAGWMYDVRIYASALTPTEQAAVHANTYSATTPVGQWIDGTDTPRSVPDAAGGTAIYHDGTDDAETAGVTLGNITSLDFWIKSHAANQQICTLADSAETAITVAAGTLTFGGSLTATAIAIDEVAKTAAAAGALINDGAWHQVQITLNSVAATAFKIGTDSSAYGNISVDEFKVGTTNYWKFDV